MAYVECMKSELDFFTPHPIQSSILKTEEIVYKPVASLDNASLIEFVSLGHGDTYRDLSSVYLKLRIKMYRNQKNEDIADDAPSTINNILHSLFKQCTIYMNGKPIAQTDHNYHYRAYIENLLNYGSDAATTHLESVGWYLDNGVLDYKGATATGGTGGASGVGGGGKRRKRYDDATPGGSEGKTDDKKEENTGLIRRNLLFTKSCEVELMGKIHGDMFNQSKLLLNNIDLRIILATENPSFYIMSQNDKDEAYIKILDATMFINHVTINPNVLLAHEKILLKSKAVYPYKRVEVKTFTIPSGSRTLSVDNVIIGQLPNLLVFGMVDNAAYSGNLLKNPYNFKHNKISQFNLCINGTYVPNTPIKFDYSVDNPVSTRGYNTLFKGTGIHFFDKGHQITKKFYDNGCFLLAFDLTTDISYNNETCTNLLNQGTIRIEGQFSENLTEAVTCIVYAEYDAAIEIDKDRNVFTSF